MCTETIEVIVYMKCSSQSNFLSRRVMIGIAIAHLHVVSSCPCRCKIASRKSPPSPSLALAIISTYIAIAVTYYIQVLSLHNACSQTRGPMTSATITCLSSILRTVYKSACTATATSLRAYERCTRMCALSLKVTCNLVVFLLVSINLSLQRPTRALTTVRAVNTHTRRSYPTSILHFYRFISQKAG